jgi:hypothetical protein
MSTEDCPGYGNAASDELKVGCWAEHNDGSLIFVESTEGGRVVYSIFDMEKSPAVEYRDAMAEGAFKKSFSWSNKDGKGDKWVWHNRTPFPWDRIIQGGVRAGAKYASADDHLNAAERIRRSREIHRGEPVDVAEVESRIDRLGEKAEGIIRRLQRAISKAPKGS